MKIKMSAFNETGNIFSKLPVHIHWILPLSLSSKHIIDWKINQHP